MHQALNEQIKYEANASQIYLSMASWAETNGFEGVAEFLFAQSDEERMHMLKLLHYVNERGGHATITTLEEPPNQFVSVKDLFQALLQHEIKVSGLINDMVAIALEEKDYATHNFLQWYVAEQIEEEATARTILDKINLIGDEKSGFYIFDKDIKALIGSVK